MISIRKSESNFVTARIIGENDEVFNTVYMGAICDERVVVATRASHIMINKFEKVYTCNQCKPMAFSAIPEFFRTFSSFSCTETISD